MLFRKTHLVLVIFVSKSCAISDAQASSIYPSTSVILFKRKKNLTFSIFNVFLEYLG